MKSSSNPILSSISKSKTVLAIVLSISMLATGCSAQWLSIALADLPVLIQMALNIGTIITTFESGQQISAAEAAAIQNAAHVARANNQVPIHARGGHHRRAKTIIKIPTAAMAPP